MDRARRENPTAFDAVLTQERNAQLRAARDRPIPIAVGNDNIVRLLHMNIYHLVDAGFTPAEARHAATGGGAKALGIDDELGTLEKGKFADIISIKPTSSPSRAGPIKTSAISRKRISLWSAVCTAD
jgi:imidazolonepropionase-like amidohydrolase